MNSENYVEPEADDEELIVTWCEDEGEGELLAGEMVAGPSLSESDVEKRDRSLAATAAMLSQVAVLALIAFVGR